MPKSSVFDVDPATGKQYFDEMCFNERFKNFRDKDLISQIQKGDGEAHEEFYLRINNDITRISLSLAKRYRLLEDDEAEFFGMVFKATENSIYSFDHSRGEFSHYWRTIIRRDKSHLIRALSGYKKQTMANTTYETYSDQPDFLESVVFSVEEMQLYAEEIENQYIDETAEAVLKFVKEKYGNPEFKILSLWMNFYSLKEISDITSLPQNQIASKLYNIMNAVRKRSKTLND